MTYTHNRDRFPSARTGQEGGDDTPLTDLKQLEDNLKVNLTKCIWDNNGLINSLGRDGVDLDIDGMVAAINDVIDDYLGLELMRLENME